jgi:hypothetical protein
MTGLFGGVDIAVPQRKDTLQFNQEIRHEISRGRRNVTGSFAKQNGANKIGTPACEYLKPQLAMFVRLCRLNLRISCDNARAVSTLDSNGTQRNAMRRRIRH